MFVCLLQAVCSCFPPGQLDSSPSEGRAHWCHLPVFTLPIRHTRSQQLNAYTVQCLHEAFQVFEEQIHIPSLNTVDFCICYTETVKV